MENIKLLHNLKISNIWSFSYDEGEYNELILDCYRIMFDFGRYSMLILDEDGKIKVSINNQTVDDILDSDILKIDLRNYILEFPDDNYYLKNVGLINSDALSDNIVCDALEINLVSEYYGEQNVFVNSGIYGLRIRSSEYYKNFWFRNWYVPLYGNTLNEIWVY